MEEATVSKDSLGKGKNVFIIGSYIYNKQENSALLLIINDDLKKINK